MINNTIKQASVNDITKIMEFIKNYWRNDHILAKNKNFFCHQYLNENKVNFILSKQDNEINGTLGFIKANSDRNSPVWTTMWKVKPNLKNPSVGILMLKYLQELNYSSIISSGINQKTLEIYKYLGFYVGELNQYFISNNKKTDYQLIRIPKVKKNPSVTLSNKIIKQINKLDLKNFLLENDKIFFPKKDFNYYYKNFFKHPIYKYEFFGVFKKNKMSSFFIIRKIKLFKTGCIRLIDFLGDELDLINISIFLKKKIEYEDLEFCDFYCYGFNKSILQKSYFTLNTSDEKSIIPNNFEPFQFKNVQKFFFISSGFDENFKITKGDGDQDRPNYSK